MLERQPDLVLELGQAPGEENNVPAPAIAAAPVAISKRCPCGCCGIKARHFKFAAYSFPVATAIREAAETAIDLSDQSPIFIITATISNFCAELSINSRFTVEGIEYSYKIIKKRSLPTDWPVLSKSKEILAATSSALMGTIAAFCDGVLAFDFVYQLPAQYKFTQSVNMIGWTGLAGLTAGFVGLGRLSGEGMATYQKARDILAGVKPEYSNALSSWVSPTAGFALGVLGSCSDYVITCNGMFYVFKITDMPVKLVVGGISSVNGVTDYCMNGAFVIECLDYFFGSFTPAEGVAPSYKNPKLIASLVLSLAAGGLLAYTYHGLAKDSLLQFFKELHVENALKAIGIEVDYAGISAVVSEIFACGGATSYLINATGSILPVFQKIADKLGDGLSAIYNKAASCCQRSTVNDDFFTEETVADEMDDDDFVFEDARDYFEDDRQDAVIIDVNQLSISDEETTELVESPARKNSFLFNLFNRAARDQHYTPQAEVPAHGYGN